ncbi:MAG: glutamate--tRNA ligase [Phycisphaerales bacterium]
MTVVTRFAPSPTGHLHIGGARSALFCWAYAKKQGGRFMIRIEDTDQARSSDESARGILEDLAWLGIEWDDGPVLRLGNRAIGADSRPVGPYFQAQRLPIYNAYVEDLCRRGIAYPAFENTDDLEVKRKAAVAAKRTYRYERPGDVVPGAPNEARWQRAQRGEPHVIRFVAPHEAIVVPDQVLGDVKIAAGELDDFVLRKADGFPTYHFAVVIDDELMGVTHVMRAQEHLANTPRHVAMQRYFKRLDTGESFKTPVYAHMPLIFNNDGSKMSKRDKAKAARKAAKDAIAKGALAVALAVATGLDPATLDQFLAGDNDSLDVAQSLGAHLKVPLPEVEIWDFRQSGYLPESIINFISLLGWNPGMKLPDGKDLEKFDRDFLAEHFSIDRIGRTNAKFDRAKLLSFNADAIAALPDDEFARRWLAWLAEYEPDAHARLAASIGAGVTPRLLMLTRALKPRAKTFRDALRPAAFILVRDDEYAFDPAAVEKNLRANNGAGLTLLTEARARLGTHVDWDAAALNTLIEGLAKECGLPNASPIAQPLRVALTGAAISPGLGETLAILGRESSLRRIDRCVAEVR